MTSFLGSLGVRRKKTPAQLVRSAIDTVQIISISTSTACGDDGKDIPSSSSSIVGLSFLEKVTSVRSSVDKDKDKEVNSSSSSSSGRSSSSSILNDRSKGSDSDGMKDGTNPDNNGTMIHPEEDISNISITTTTTDILELTEPEKKLCSRLHEMKVILYGEAEKEVDEDKANELSRCIQNESLVMILVDKILIVPFEARKDISQIFNNLVRKNILNFVNYLQDHSSLIDALIEGYNHPDVALISGSMLRECIRHDSLARLIMKSEKLWLFFDKFLHLPNFDVASDAFNSLRDLLTTQKNKAISAEFLEINFDKLFSKYESLLLSENYVTKRRSLKLLSGILLERINFNVMIKYISSKDNLKLIMNQLRDQSSNIQFEAFHVFKIFVAYPNKPADISNILFRNRVKLIAYLESFHLDSEDLQFHDEKRLLIETLHGLEEIELNKSTSPSNTSNVTGEGTVSASANEKNVTERVSSINLSDSNSNSNNNST